jgi:hypothetical protein
MHLNIMELYQLIYFVAELFQQNVRPVVMGTGNPI